MTEINTAIPIEESSGIKLDPEKESSGIKLDPEEESYGIKLDPEEERILKDQIDVPERKESYITLYRFATKLDWIIMFIGLVFSMVTGAAMPLIPTFVGNMIDNYARFQNHSISIIDFNESVNHLTVIFVCIAIVVFVATYISIATWVYTGER
ncbi:2061_t:CDS:2 [Dentiscutata heterogama]|uniref:2061_t:CDS:1 n=1 Tax=Dentiscutata heterogama TaxID=1316150 RepID=A0ACA9JZA8_9GLOM|nr:2061_t:CDS:2 [Dentiscutata heterogama]